ncbi:synaptotagmin-like protein 3 isoform X2 [Amia ocellicauda]|uniref:synaptotagmin-like protein 3 isoform X2 n=1 Tax=Amia ocellicauda TaxID=2972642 RepID=UPI0034648A50
MYFSRTLNTAEDMDISFLKELEREKVLEVLQRDRSLRTIDEERIRKLKLELQEIRRKGVKSLSREYMQRSCARCQRPLGKLWNTGAVCKGCSHRICSRCRVTTATRVWKCTVCYAYGEVKIKSGEWFLEERAKKFPADGEKNETVGERLLKSCQRLRAVMSRGDVERVRPVDFSHSFKNDICIVPPTPTLEVTSTFPSKPGGLQNSRGFTKSVENLFVSLTTHMKKMSKSQNDVTVDQSLLTADYGESTRKERRSLSDPAINTSATLTKAPSLPILYKKVEYEADDNCDSMDEYRSTNTLYSGAEKRDSIYSISSTCTDPGNYDNASVTGEMELRIVYDFKSTCLQISIKTCKNLAYGDAKRKKCNPYIKVYLLPDKPHSKQKTAIKKNTVDPVFNETLWYNIDRSQLETRTLHASVWHAGTLKRKVFLGEVLIPLGVWRFDDSSTQSYQWYTLGSKPDRYDECIQAQYNGELLIKAKFTLTSQESIVHTKKDETLMEMTGFGQLTILIIEAKNLPSLRPDGTVNAFIKACLTLPGERELKQKTPVLKRTSYPQWNHQIMFGGVSQAEVLDACLVLSVWDQAPFGRSDRFLGGAQLDRATAQMSCSAELPWQQLLRRPNTWQNFHLIIHPNINMMKT